MSENGAARVRERTRSQGSSVTTVEHMEVRNSRREVVSEEHVDERLPVDLGNYQGPVGYVRVEGSVTQNMGDFNSVRVAVAVEMPCRPTPEGADRMYQWCSGFVDERVNSELDMATGGVASSGQ